MRYARKKPAEARNTVRATETRSPPIRARAKGAYDSLPSPIFKAIGINPMMVASEVIRMGRSRTRQDSTIRDGE